LKFLHVKLLFEGSGAFKIPSIKFECALYPHLIDGIFGTRVKKCILYHLQGQEGTAKGG